MRRVTPHRSVGWPGRRTLFLHSPPETQRLIVPHSPRGEPRVYVIFMKKEGESGVGGFDPLSAPLLIANLNAAMYS